MLLEHDYFKNENRMSIFLFMMAGFIFFIPTSVGTNEPKAPQECLRQKVFFYPDYSGSKPP